MYALRNLAALIFCRHDSVTYKYTTTRGDGKYKYTTYVCDFCRRGLRRRDGR